MQFVIPAVPPATVPVVGTDALFPVHRIYCVGRNYVDHAIEMGATGREPPFFFMKPADAVFPVPYGTVGQLPYPAMTEDYQYELELVVAIGKTGENIAAADAMQYVWGYAIGLDMTRRDVQAEAKSLRRPWDTGKAFEQSAPIGPIHPASDIGAVGSRAIQLNVNGQTKQKSTVDKLIWNIEEMIAYLSQYFVLQPGDLIMTGTPAGVAAVKKGDLMEGSIEGLGELRLKVV
ncbi:MAG: fumarylacetoacetate hydrolase family protein [Pseudomonadota bacterium]|uniref:fumarylacetoacetate hydrolase family protein n=1 Tax=Herminiimonas arsenitoxidans TaxID=1809410 RepID=UPI0009702FDB|nr:fumarylacetoacetate hydrolase family protein [Herminiimonas arsenitoxidans]